MSHARSYPRPGRGRFVLGSSLAAALLLASAPGRMAAQQAEERGPLAVGVSVSTLGLGPEVSLHLSPVFGVRGGLHWMSASLEETVEDVDYEIRPDWRNLTALADLHPFSNAFRLTAGLVWWNTEAEADAVLAAPIEIGNRVFQPAEVGMLTGRAEYGRKLAPLVGLGVAGRGRFAVTFDLGVVFAGHPTIELDVRSPLTGAALAELEAEVRREEAEIQQAVDDEPWARLYPVMALGFKLRF